MRLITHNHTVFQLPNALYYEIEILYYLLLGNDTVGLRIRKTRG